MTASVSEGAVEKGILFNRYSFMYDLWVNNRIKNSRCGKYNMNGGFFQGFIVGPELCSIFVSGLEENKSKFVDYVKVVPEWWSMKKEQQLYSVLWIVWVTGFNMAKCFYRAGAHYACYGKDWRL